MQADARGSDDIILLCVTHTATLRVRHC